MLGEGLHVDVSLVVGVGVDDMRLVGGISRRGRGEEHAVGVCGCLFADEGLAGLKRCD